MTKSLGLRIYASGKPSLVGARVIPMSKEDAEGWRLLAERRAIAAANAAAPRHSAKPEPDKPSRPFGRVSHIAGEPK